MTKRRAHFHSLWLLPILVLRGLMPAGTMLDVSNGSPSVVMCSGGFFTVSTGSHHNDSTTQHNAEHYSVCPFAMALGAATPVNIVSLVNFATFIVTDNVVTVASHNSLSGPIRTHLSRAPPALS